MGKTNYVLTLTCTDTVGIVAAVAGFLAERAANIRESRQFEDSSTGRFFMRTVFEGDLSIDEVRVGFAPIARRFGMEWQVHDLADRPRMLLAVSKFGHCLNDLLHRYKSGTLPVEIPAIVSNHEDMRSLSEWHGIPYYHLPMGAGGKAEQEARILELIETLQIDFLVLARYMQVLSPELCERLAWKCINIHHSFLPSFKGAKPYHQAHARGVKLIGATAHYVTPDLDEGPIIEQASERVDHAQTAEDFVNIGRDVESIVLARAVLWHAEHRVLPNGNKTVVFR